MPYVLGPDLVHLNINNFSRVPEAAVDLDIPLVAITGATIIAPFQICHAKGLGTTVIVGP